MLEISPSLSQFEAFYAISGEDIVMALIKFGAKSPICLHRPLRTMASIISRQKNPLSFAIRHVLLETHFTAAEFPKSKNI